MLHVVGGPCRRAVHREHVAELDEGFLSTFPMDWLEASTAGGFYVSRNQQLEPTTNQNSEWEKQPIRMRYLAEEPNVHLCRTRDRAETHHSARPSDSARSERSSDVALS